MPLFPPFENRDEAKQAIEDITTLPLNAAGKIAQIIVQDPEQPRSGKLIFK